MRLFNDGPMLAAAERIMEIFPRWLVIWGHYTSEFWAYPCFRTPAGTVLHAGEPSVLAGRMHLVQRAVPDGAPIRTPAEVNQVNAKQKGQHT